MTYASLSEVYGTDFSNLVNPQKQQQYVTKKSNPNVMNHNRSRNLKELKNQSMIQQEMDYDTQMQSFNSVSSNNNVMYRERAWDNGNEMVNMLSPKEHLKQSLLKNRKITTESMVQQEPDGYSHMNPYKTFERTKCDDMFFHLDTCRRCQNKLKKRVIRYFNLLKEQNQDNVLLPGASGMDSELFIDTEVKSQPKVVHHKKEVKENFTNKKSFDSKILLLLFGLFIIYSLDSQK